jgi:hypothetical protein
VKPSLVHFSAYFIIPFVHSHSFAFSPVLFSVIAQKGRSDILQCYSFLYSHLKEEALDRIKWRNRFGRGCGPVVWQITDEWVSYNRSSQIFEKCNSYPKMLRATRVIWIKFRAEDPQILGSTGKEFNCPCDLAFGISAPLASLWNAAWVIRPATLGPHFLGAL